MCALFLTRTETKTEGGRGVASSRQGRSNNRDRTTILSKFLWFTGSLVLFSSGIDPQEQEGCRGPARPPGRCSLSGVECCQMWVNRSGFGLPSRRNRFSPVFCYPHQSQLAAGGTDLFLQSWAQNLGLSYFRPNFLQNIF